MSFEYELFSGDYEGRLPSLIACAVSLMFSVYGKVKTELSLSERVYSCSSWALRIDRDVNAAINISRIVARSSGNLPGEFGDIEIERRSDLPRRGDTSRAQNSLPKSHYGEIGL